MPKKGNSVDDRAFREWKAAVNAVIEREVGLSVDDIDDFGYRDAFDSGVSPKECALDALSNAGFDAYEEYDEDYDDSDDFYV